MENYSHYICLSLDPKERLPHIKGCFHDLKSKNIFSCISEIIFSTENYIIIKKTGTLNNIEIDIILTYYNSKEKPDENKLIRGYLYIKKK